MKQIGEAALTGNAAGGEAVFELVQGDNLFIPYGSYPHRLGTQIFDRASAERMVVAHNGSDGAGLLGKIKRMVSGSAVYPIYIGHPDLPGSKDTDKRAYGWVETIAAGNDGMRLGVRWTEAGRDLVAAGHFRFYSPVWWLARERRGQVPVEFKSIGLTNEPNIPVPALANESETETTNNTTMNPEILAALGLDDGATPEEVLAKINALQQAAGDATAARGETEAATAEAMQRAETAENERAAAIAERDSARGEVTAANEELDGLRRGLIGRAVADAIAAGRIAPAEAQAQADALAANDDLAAGIAELDARPKKIKTASSTGDLGGARARLVTAHNDATAAAREERRQLVDNEYEVTNPALPEPRRRQIAWQRAAAKHPEKFSHKSPEAAG